MFVAVLAHDVDHPGNTNAWEVATRSPLAVKYKDTAVLENHHAAIGLQILHDASCNMFSTLGANELAETRETYLHAILQTDMAQHFKMVDRLKEIKAATEETSEVELARPRSPTSVFTRLPCTLPEHRREVVGVLVHSVDISSPLLPNFDLTMTWAKRITEEFQNQYNNEIKLGLPPTKMWEGLHEPVRFYRCQIGFIDGIVSPLWGLLVDFFPDLEGVGKLRSSLKTNQLRWNELRDEEEEVKELSPAAVQLKDAEAAKTSSANAEEAKKVAEEPGAQPTREVS